jgi:hypothetical protein
MVVLAGSSRHVPAAVASEALDACSDAVGRRTVEADSVIAWPPATRPARV